MKFNIGDTAWIARAGQADKLITCPDCFGKRFLTVILGDDSRITIECRGCQSGYDAPSGVITMYEYQAKAEQITIDGLECATGEETRYKYNKSGGCCNMIDEKDCFPTKTDAIARAEVLKSEHEAEELKRLTRLKHNEARTCAWNATYHRRELKRALRDVEYHTEKLNVAKLKSKEQVIEEVRNIPI